MICKVTQTTTEQKNGKNITNTDEREEKIPVKSNQLHSVDPAMHENLKSLFSGFGDFFSFGSELHPMDDMFKKTFGQKSQFDDFFKEMDERFSFSNGSSDKFHEENRAQNFQNRFQTEKQGTEYDYQFRKNKSDKDIYDV